MAKRLFFSSYRSGTAEIWVCSSDGRNAKQITAFRSPQTVGSPRWSPDGRQIVFDTRAAGNADIYIISAEGGKPRRLTTEESEDMVPSFSHDGSWIYFCSNRSGSQQIWKLPAAGGQAVQVTRQGGFDNMESPDGHYLYYAKGRGVSGIWRVPIAGGEETLVLDHHRAGAWRYWAVVPQGIYFLTAETAEHPLLEFFNFATNKIVPIITLEKKIASQSSSLSVSPDGHTLIWSQLDQEGSDIMLLDNFR
jgi:Tol biopolymer transport system component